MKPKKQREKTYEKQQTGNLQHLKFSAKIQDDGQNLEN